MVRTPQFFLLWIMFVFGAGAGLMIIGKLAKIVDLQAGIKPGLSSSPCWPLEMPPGGSLPGSFDKIGHLDDVCGLRFPGRPHVPPARPGRLRHPLLGLGAHRL
jgi:hypothetical protein